MKVSDEAADNSVRVEATRTLWRFGDARLLPDLERIADQNVDGSVRPAARRAAEQIRQRLSGK
ncbi:MAG: hypothetical protein K8G79_02850 [bacterium]|uniref:HEAT repeat domain-containing protein n=1 Tax=Candidatus Methylomirabilis tolerans TaxID=3123416 RepID=A0AAJ1ES81_9BACT|nr:hypothetical protein [Candidatus Methylomirabilis sp.]